MAPDELATLQQEVAVLKAKHEAGCDRMDRMEKNFEEAIVRIENAVAPLGSQLTELNGWMNRSKGWAAAALLLAGGIGWLVKALVNKP